MKKSIIITVIAAVGSFQMSTSGQLVNGSFEAPPGQYVVGSPAPTGFGWVLNWGQVDVLQAGYNSVSWQASQGIQSLDLNGWTAGSIYQDFSFAGFGNWAIRFDMSANPDSSALKSLEVFFGETGGPLTSLGVHSVSPAGHTRTDMMWQTIETPMLSVDAGKSYRLQFDSLTSGGAGAALDNVRLVIVPEPTSTALLGMALCAFLVRRPRRHHGLAGAKK